jgi:catechol 2,3-dioxygenase-like lactoylglutathione lyase family enzyme
MPARGIQHVDLAVSDVDRSLAFYKDLLGPLGLQEEERYPTYRGTGAIGSTPGYYALFVFDPDGLRIEVFSPGPQWSSRIHRPADFRGGTAR